MAALHCHSSNAPDEHCSQMFTGCSIAGGIPWDQQPLSDESKPLRLSADTDHIQPCHHMLAEVCSASCFIGIMQLRAQPHVAHGCLLRAGRADPSPMMTSCKCLKPAKHSRRDLLFLVSPPFVRSTEMAMLTPKVCCCIIQYTLLLEQQG